MDEDKIRFIGKAIKKAGEFLEGEPSEQTLLKEYEVSQQAINALASRYWTIVGIFMAVNTGVLAWTVSVLTSNSLCHTNVDAKWLVLALASGMVITLIFLWNWIIRINVYVSIKYFRMREIEGKLGMLANLTIEWYDHQKRYRLNKAKE